MKSNVKRMLYMLSTLVLGLILMATAASAQQGSGGTKPSSSDDTTAASDAAGESAGNFNIISSIEFGYRGIEVSGNERKYRSDLNYKAGPRLFDSSFMMRSKENKGGWINSLMVTSTGWGADPYGQVRVSAEQSDWYRFDASYRKFKTYRALNTFANPNWIFGSVVIPPNPVTGEHDLNTKEQIGDFDLTILPKNERIKFYAGYSPERYEGPAYTNYHAGGNDFNFLSQVRSQANDFRFGADARVGPIDLSFLQGFRFFKDDSFVAIGSTQGLNPASTAADFTHFNRDNPVRGRQNYSRFSAHTFLAQRLDITGRIVYSSSSVDNNFVENIGAINWNTRLSGNTYATPNVLNLGLYNYIGEASRPNTIGDLGVTFLATNKLRISNTFRVETFQINGSNIANSLFLITKNNLPTPPLVNNQNQSDFEITKYRKYQDTVEGDYQFNKNYAVHFGYRYGNRWTEITSGGFALGGYTPATTPNPTVSDTEENHTHAWFGGFRVRPVKNLTLYGDFEKGTADNVFTRVGNYDYTNIRAKAKYAPSRKFGFNMALITRNNANPSEIAGVSISDFGLTVQSRLFQSSFDINVNPRFSISTGYNYTWINSNAVIDYYYNSIRHPLGHSLYYVRNNYFFVDTVARLFPRATLYLSYHINDDNGQGNRLPDPNGTPGFLVTSYPMSFMGPEGRLAIKINRRLDWNIGYQYYNYNESALVSPLPQNYHAHLPYTSLRLYFGRAE